jgi:8-oxo-dGTP diphosphatase
VKTSPVPCAGGIIFDADGRLLVIRRGTPPAAGSWSVPGGRCEPGESAEAACVREVAEETGLAVAVLSFAGRVQRDGPEGVIYDIDDYICTVVGGTLRAATDASDARWVTRGQLLELDLVAGLIDALTEWAALPT